MNSNLKITSFTVFKSQLFCDFFLAWNLKFNLGRDRGYSISELNEDDRRKVEEIKAKLFGHGRATHMSEV